MTMFTKPVCLVNNLRLRALQKNPVAHNNNKTWCWGWGYCLTDKNSCRYFMESGAGAEGQAVAQTSENVHLYVRIMPESKLKGWIFSSRLKASQLHSSTNLPLGLYGETGTTVSGTTFNKKILKKDNCAASVGVCVRCVYNRDGGIADIIATEVEWCTTDFDDNYQFKQKNLFFYRRHRTTLPL